MSQFLHYDDNNTDIKAKAIIQVFSKNSQAYKTILMSINPSQNKPVLLRVCSTSLMKTLWEKEQLLFPTAFSTLLVNFLPFSLNLKLSSASSFSLEESKICHWING